MTSQTNIAGYRQNLVAETRTWVNNLESELKLGKRILGELTGNSTSRAGTAGGIRARRTTGRTAGRTGNAATSSREWITGLLRQHGEGLTAAQLKQMAITAGRNVYANYPNDVLSKMRAKREVTHRGNKYFLAGNIGGTGPVTRAGRARTTARGRKPMGRAMGAAG